MPVLREFRASRLTRGNLLFPDILRLEDDCVVRVKRGWFSSDEESIAYPRIASVRVRAGLIFATMLIESSGGTDPMEFNGLTKGSAHEAHDLLQQLQMKAMGQVTAKDKT
jgi:uncharacterized membrane protein YdbT with pleckstrin-like domain